MEEGAEVSLIPVAFRSCGSRERVPWPNRLCTCDTPAFQRDTVECPHSKPGGADCKIGRKPRSNYLASRILHLASTYGRGCAPAVRFTGFGLPATVDTGELDKAAQTFQDVIERYPREPDAYDDLGLVFGGQGQYEKAVEIARQALRLADKVGLYGNICNYAVALQRFEEARQIIHGAQARKLDDLGMHNASYALAFLGGDSIVMAEQQQWFAARPEYENYGLALASGTEAFTGHRGKARELTKRAVDSAVRADSKENGAIWQPIAAQREAAYGNAAEARQTATRAFRVEESGVSGRLSLAGIRRFQLRARLGPPWLTYSPPSQIPPSGITAAGSSSDTPRVSPGMRDPGR